MADDIYERWGDILHEVPELEGRLREYRRRQAREAIRRRLEGDQTATLVHTMAGYPPYVDHRD